MYTLEAKDNMERYASQIKILANQKVLVDSDIDTISRLPCTKNSGIVALPSHYKNNKTPNNEVTHNYFVVFRRSGIPGRNYMLHIS